MSTVTLKIFTAASEPVTSWPQAPPSRVTCASCAQLVGTKIGETKIGETNGAATASTRANPTTCSERFKIATSLLTMQNEEFRMQKCRSLVCLYFCILTSDF